jgi:negative regulator of flagellin synthesis FlgM
MKIDKSHMNYEIQKQMSALTQGANETQAGKTRAGGQENAQDTIVELSPASKEAQQIKQVIDSQPEIRAEKINAIKEDIKAGKLDVDNTKLADKIVTAFMEELF